MIISRPDNPIASVKVARNLEERERNLKILPNPFGGVNTHLWRNDPTTTVLSKLFVTPILRSKIHEGEKE